MTPLEPQGAHDTHRRFFQMVLRHGTEAEKAEVKETMRILVQMRREEPTSFLYPMEKIVLPSFLIERSERVARARQARAKRFSLNNKHGVRRTLEEEIRTVEGQTAACLMLGMPIGEAATEQDSRRSGNLGGNLSAFVPRLGHYNLIVGEKEPPGRVFFLIVPETDHTYSWPGWIRAGEVQKDEFQRTYIRNGVTSNPFFVPADYLSKPKSWFGG